MSILSKLTRQRLTANPPVPAQKTPDPETPIPATPESELVQLCAACGKPGATINLIVSYFGYITLPYVYLCETCEQARIAGKKQHYMDLHRRPIAAKETIETSAL